MQIIGQLGLLVYAGLLLVGGIVGYVKAQSKISLLSGIGSAVLIGVAYGLTRSNPGLGFGLATGVALALTIVFLIRFRKTQALMPAGLMSGLSLIMAALTGWVLLQPGS